MSKLFIYDCETTGVDTSQSAIIQLAGRIVIDGQTKETFNLLVRPHGGADISAEALKVNRRTEEEIRDFPDPWTFKETLIGILSKYVDKFSPRDKFHLVGYNNRNFDDQMLRAFFERHLDKYFGSWFWSDSIDVMILASEHLREQRPTMKDFKLRTVAQQLEIPIDESKLHDAQYDIDLTIRIWQRILSERMKSGGKVYEALRKLVDLHTAEQEGISSGMPSPEDWSVAVSIATEALGQGGSHE